MPKKKKRNPRLKDRMNNWRQKQNLRIGVVMLPDLKTEGSVVGQYLKDIAKRGDVV